MNTACPFCGKTREIRVYQDDFKTVQAAGELMWVCPKDLTPYQVLKESESKKSFSYDLICPTCNVKVKKEIEKPYIDMVKKGQGQKSTNLELIDGNFVKYHFP